MILMIFGVILAIVYRIYLIEKRLVVNQMTLDSITNLLTQQIFKEKKESKTNILGDNRKPRTDAQRAASSERRKQWWAKKKASENALSEAVEEIKN